jgi:hypothetical protein
MVAPRWTSEQDAVTQRTDLTIKQMVKTLIDAGFPCTYGSVVARRQVLRTAERWGLPLYTDNRKLTEADVAEIRRSDEADIGYRPAF